MDNDGSETGNCPMHIAGASRLARKSSFLVDTVMKKTISCLLKYSTLKQDSSFQDPICHNIVALTAATVNNKLLVFAKRIEGDRDIGEIHVLETGQPNSTWKTTSSTLPTDRFV